MASNSGGRSSAGASTRGEERRELQQCNLSACSPAGNGAVGWMVRKHWHPINPITKATMFEEAFSSPKCALPTAAEEGVMAPRGGDKGRGTDNSKGKGRVKSRGRKATKQKTVTTSTPQPSLSPAPGTSTPTEEEEYSGRLGGAYQAAIPELETMPVSRPEASPATASSAARAATCRQIWAAVKPTAAGDHSTQEQKEKELFIMCANCLVHEFKGRIPVDRCLEVVYRTRESGTSVYERFRSARGQLHELETDGTSTCVQRQWTETENELFSIAMVSNGRKDFSAISERLGQQSIMRTAGECSTRYNSGWKTGPAYLALKTSKKYDEVVKIARNDKLECCHRCHRKGLLVYCEGACSKGFHAACVNLDAIPEGSWVCSSCDQSPGANARRKVVAEQTARAVTFTKETAADAAADAAALLAVMASSEALVDAARAEITDMTTSAGTATDAARATLDVSLRNCARCFDPLRRDPWCDSKLGKRK